MSISQVTGMQREGGSVHSGINSFIPVSFMAGGPTVEFACSLREHVGSPWLFQVPLTFQFISQNKTGHF